MIILKTVEKLRSFIEKKKVLNESIGFVPTMGALHEGHMSLIGASAKENKSTVCSIFINPTQFNNAADFDKYPITIENDIDKLEDSGCDLLFLPSVSEIYPPGMPIHNFNLGYLETVLEGAFRPGHYQGVCQVVERLLDIVQPRILYLGQKDYQQCMVIKKMLELTHSDVFIYIGKTVREEDGLAMSSRNTRLHHTQRKQAAKIYEALVLMKNELAPGNLDNIKQKGNSFLSQNGFKVDYTEIANASDLQLLQAWDGSTPVVILIAAWLNDVRLIDNLLL